MTMTRTPKLERNPRQIMLRNRDWFLYLKDGDRTELIIRQEPFGHSQLPYGLYRETDRPHVTWANGQAGLRRLVTVPASLLEKDKPWVQVKP